MGQGILSELERVRLKARVFLECALLPEAQDTDPKVTIPANPQTNRMFTVRFIAMLQIYGISTPLAGPCFIFPETSNPNQLFSSRILIYY
jgi:hypothetical protein